MKKILIVLLFVVAGTTAFSQTCELKHPVTTEDKKELLKTIKALFALEPEISYNISSNDLYANFDKMVKREAFDQQYLEKYEKLLRAAPANPFYAKALGDYYNFNEQYALSNGYFQLALEHTDISYFKNDSAAYYSFRGMLHYNLSDSTGLGEFEKAFAINATDSMMISLYPVLLLSDGQFDKARQLAEAAMKKDEKYPSTPFILFAMAEIFGQDHQNRLKLAEDSTLNKRYREKDYNQLIDFTPIDEYSNRYAKDMKMQQARRMVDVLVLMSKVQYFEQNADMSMKLAYTVNDIAALKALDKWFEKSWKNKSLNSFTACKNLGYIHFMLKDNNKAIALFSKALEVFPIDKRGPFFNETDVYSGLIYIAHEKKDKTLFKNTLVSKMKAEPIGKKDFQDYRWMSELYFSLDSTGQAMEWAVKTKAIYPGDCRNLMLLAHLSQLQGYFILSDSYFDEANKNIKSNEELLDLYVSIMCYKLLNNDVDQFCALYNNMEEQLGKGACIACDALKQKYVNVIPAK